MWKALKGLFSTSKVVDTGLNIVNKIAGTDWLPEKKAQFILDFMEKTKYQSGTRRFLAIVFVFEWFVLVNFWLGSSFAYRIYDHAGAGLFASDIKAFLTSDINLTISGIVAFYFLMGMKKS
ncbi:MAG: hypothetical protein P8I94_11615 [Emcibacteraceae bacterium]|nr:hypothetical protein [Emcibacteraceae bacterium]